MLDEVLVLRRERGGKMAVDIELSDDFAIHKYGHNDFGLCFERTREVTRVLTDIVYYHCLPTGSGRAANTLVQRDARMWGHGTFEGSQNKYRRLRSGLEHVEPNPVVFQHPIVQKLCHVSHEILG